MTALLPCGSCRTGEYKLTAGISSAYHSLALYNEIIARARIIIKIGSD